MYYLELALIVVLVLILLIVHFSGFYKTEKTEKMSVLSERKADLIRDRAGNTELDYDLTALMRTQTGLPIAV